MNDDKKMVEKVDKQSNSDYIRNLQQTYREFDARSVKHLEKELVAKKNKKTENKELRPVVGDYVLISKPPTGLGHGADVNRWFGPRKVFKIIADNTYILLDLNTKVEAGYDISRLKIYRNHRNLTEKELASEAAKDKGEWIVDEIVAHRLSPGNGNEKKSNKSSYQFFVRWDGSPREEDTWEPYSNLGADNAALYEYVKKTPSLQGVFRR
jgi:hypothetical protein